MKEDNKEAIAIIILTFVVLAEKFLNINFVRNKGKEKNENSSHKHVLSSNFWRS